MGYRSWLERAKQNDIVRLKPTSSKNDSGAKKPATTSHEAETVTHTDEQQERKAA